MLRVPVATYRLQFNAGFTFADAEAITTYLSDLGISDIYASPILKARKGSTHGYDVVDPGLLNPELGTEAAFDALHEALKRCSMGLLLDVVPNHMAASEENTWWISVLENGPGSRYLHFFDIERIEQKILLPILGKPYGEALEGGEIKLGFDREGFFFRYYDHRLPLAPSSYRLVLQDCVDAMPTEGVAIELRELVTGDESVTNSRFLKETLWRIYDQDAEFRESLERTIRAMNREEDGVYSWDHMDRLLDAQYYRLAYWRIASEKINYRRFFDVTDLVGVRVENPEVFEARNRRTLELVAEGKVTGLRIDHIDGLHDPVGHMKKLQLRLAEPDSHPDSNPDPHGPFYIVVEKILAAGESLPADFPVAGTTGYDFLNSLNVVFVDSAGLGKLTRFYRSFTGLEERFGALCYERKKQVIAELFAGEMRTLGKQLSSISVADRNARDFTPSEMLSALTEVTASMSVYRTYVRDREVSAFDRMVVHEAIAAAQKRAGTSIDHRLFDFLERVLLADPPEYLAGEREHWLVFVMRWQQFTGRVMAKGVEDTAFYNYNRLIALSEVGGEPGRDDAFDGLAEFHSRNAQQLHHWPDTLNATSTHDTKRSEDVRARIDVLAEMPDAWERNVRKWSAMNAPARAGDGPDSNEELLIYQTLLGMWPVDDRDVAGVPARLAQFLEKALREAKTHSSWITPDGSYESSVIDFAEKMLVNEQFMTSFRRFEKRVSFYGFLNALAQVVLKVTAPGVPDFYQGTETWDLSLVDPDNRRAVDYEKRRRMLRSLQAADANAATDFAKLLRTWRDGRIKMFVTWKSLQFRSKHIEAFRRGSYEPVDGGKNCAAFSRGDEVLIAVPRLVTDLVSPAEFPLGDCWGEQALEVGGSWRNTFTGDAVQGERLLLRDVFARFPVALLERV